MAPRLCLAVWALFAAANAVRPSAVLKQTEIRSEGAGLTDAKHDKNAAKESGRGKCEPQPPEDDKELEADISQFAADNPVYRKFHERAMRDIQAPGEDDAPLGDEASVTAAAKKPSDDEVHLSPDGFNFHCPLGASRQARLDAAGKVGGNVRRVAQLFNEFNAWIWSDGEERPINPANDTKLLEKGSLWGLGATWATLRSAGLVAMLLPTLLLTDGGNRTTWFLQSAQSTCWRPSPLGSGPMIFDWSHVHTSLGDPGQLRGYYTATVPQVEDFFDPETPLFLDGDRHRAFRDLLENVSFARRYNVNVSFANSSRELSSTGCTPPAEEEIAGRVGPLVSEAIWGEVPSPEALAAMMTYAKYGKYAIFGKDIHAVLKPVGIAGKIKDSLAEVTDWAHNTKFGKLMLKARDHHFPSYDPRRRWFNEDRRLIDVMSVATLFAGMVGTTDMTLKCVKFQKRDASHEELFKADPEKYLIELMRYDSAVTSVTALLPQTESFDIEGRVLQLLKGTPTQMVIATANRDPTHWTDPDVFNSNRSDLADTLSWNGRAADVEERSLERAPRHCPGFCLSLKVAAAVCAGVMGSFDELEKEGKILNNSGAVQCSNFGNHTEPRPWTPPAAAVDTQAPAPPQDEDEGAVMLHSGKECKSADYYVGTYDTLAECVRDVKAAGGKFFKYSTRSRECHIEYTTSAGCPEDFETASYDFYDIPEIPLEDALMSHANVVQVSIVDYDGKLKQQGILENSQFRNEAVVLATKNSYTKWWSWWDSQWCNREYRLGVQAGGIAVETWEACCEAARKCDVPSELSRVKVHMLNEMNEKKGVWGENTFIEELVGLGEEELCHEPEDSAYTVSQAVYPPLPPSPPVRTCLRLAVVSTSKSLRQIVNSCSGLKKWVIKSVGDLAHHWWGQKDMDDDPTHVLESFANKDADSSTFDPDTFDQFTIGMFLSIVHMQGRNLDVSDRSPQQRIALPTKQSFLDRYTAYDFIGMPSTEIDGDNSAEIDQNVACVVDVMRSYPFTDDDLDEHNVWDRILGEKPGVASHCPNQMQKCTKAEFIRGAYEKYTTKSGIPVYPLTQFPYAEKWLVNGAWNDEVETYLAWTQYGAHHLQASQVHDGTGFVIRTAELAGLAVRPGFSKVGADMYFNAEGTPVMIETPKGDRLWRSEVDSKTWQYWKFVWRSSLFLKVTLVDHLWCTHFTAANSLAGAAREALPADHPLRRLLTMFTFGTIEVNNNAFHQLLGPRALLHRSAPFSDFHQITQVAQEAIPSLKSRFGPFVKKEEMDALPKKVQEAPFFVDGQEMFDSIKQLVDQWWGVYQTGATKDWWCENGILKNEPLKFFFRRIPTWSMFTQNKTNFDEDKEFLGLFGPDGHSIRCEGAKLWLSIHFFHVSGYHRHVGTVADSAADPDFAGFSWMQGEAFTRPREALQLSLIASSTATKWPKISEDYSFLAEGIDKEQDARQVLKNFWEAMKTLKGSIEEKNTRRPIPFLNMHPDEVEISVAV